MRSVDECPYRADVHGEGASETAHCRLLARISGIEEVRRSAVGRDACAACCAAPPPAPVSLNVVLASLLFPLARAVIAEGGVPGCDVERAQDLEDRALRALPWAAPSFGAPPPARNVGPCFHLGAQTGLRACTTCRGSVRVKVFQCHHLLHDQTTMAECQVCPDFDARLERGTVRAWAVGVTTAPRLGPTLGRCLASLAVAGWDAPRLFAEPGTAVPPEFTHLPITHRDQTLGGWPNWHLGLAELFLRHPSADAYLMVQDDAVFSRNARAFLETELWPAPRSGVLSIYCPERYARPDFGWQELHDQHWLVGALAFVFPNAAARSLLQHPCVLDYRRFGVQNGMSGIDHAVGRWAAAAKLPASYLSPSLVQHIGDTSTLWPGAPNSGTRRSANFAGEDFDARSLLGPTAADTGDPVRVGFWSPNYVMGGAAIWHDQLLPALDRSRVELRGLAVLNPTPRDPELVARVPTRVEFGPEALGRLAREVEVLVCWGMVPPADQLPGPPLRPLMVMVSHGDGHCKGTRATMAQASPITDRYVAVSEAALETVPPDRRRDAVVIRNGLDPARVAPRLSRAAARAVWGLRDDQVVILSNGRLSSEKAPRVLAEALALLPERFIGLIAGDGPHRAEVETACAAVGARARLIGVHHQVGDLLAAADVLLNPSESEGFGFALTEALLAGLPVLSTPLGIAATFPGLVRVVPRGAPAATWAAALLADEAEPDRTAARVANARRFARDTLSAVRFGREWSDFLWALARTSPRVPAPGPAA